MKATEWTEEFPAAITVCDADGVIIGMNRRSCLSFSAEGGARLIGTSLLDCHPEPAKTKAAGLLQSETLNVYTIEKGGVKKLIYQCPWFENGRYAGIVELSLPIPDEIPHFVRDLPAAE